MTLPDDPAAFVADWLEAWNTHDLDRLLAHFDPAVVFTSPVAARILPETSGVLGDREALRRYWTRGLELIPDLRFTVESYSVGVDAIVITYRNQLGAVVNEVLVFGASATVVSGHGTYPQGSDNPAGVRD